MSTPELQHLVTHCGMRLRRIAESRDWPGHGHDPLHQLFGEVAVGGHSSVETLRRLMSGVGIRDVDGATLGALSADDLGYFWRGYYGGWAAEEAGHATTNA